MFNGALEQKVDEILQKQDENGFFPTYRAIKTQNTQKIKPKESVNNIFLHALILERLVRVASLEKIENSFAKGVEYLLENSLELGRNYFWRWIKHPENEDYLYPPDEDDTAAGTIVLELAKHKFPGLWNKLIHKYPLLKEQNYSELLKKRIIQTEKGAFVQTFMEEFGKKDNNLFDPAVNANVLYALLIQPNPDNQLTQRIANHLSTFVHSTAFTKELTASSRFYLSSAWLSYRIADCIEISPERFEIETKIRLKERMKDYGPRNVLEIALAAGTLLKLGVIDEQVFSWVKEIEKLPKCAYPLYQHQRKNQVFGSKAFTEVICLETLIRFNEANENKTISKKHKSEEYFQLGEYKRKINFHLERLFENKLLALPRTSKIQDNSLEEMVKSLKEFTLRGGKRIRPMLMVAGHDCYHEENEEIIKTSTAIELMESFLLIHDDIIDEDTLRRGKPTLHKIYAKSKPGQATNSFGRNMALIGGDILSAWGIEVLLQSKFSDKTKTKAAAIFLNTITETCYGQILDIYSQYQKDLTEEEIFNLHRLKTARYSFITPLKIGAILGEASNQEYFCLEEYGLYLGLAFQLQDDILGLFGDEQKLGKPIGSDLREGKKTLLMIKAGQKATLLEKTKLNGILGKKNLALEEIEYVREMVKFTGSLDYSLRKIQDYTEKAKSAIADARLRIEGKEFLINLADYLEKREF